MLKNASFLAIVAVHRAENEPLKNWAVIEFKIPSQDRDLARDFGLPGAGVAEELHVESLRREPVEVRELAVGHDTSLFSRLVLGWIETKFCNQIRIFSGFSRSTKLSG